MSAGQHTIIHTPLKQTHSITLHLPASHASGSCGSVREQHAIGLPWSAPMSAHATWHPGCFTRTNFRPFLCQVVLDVGFKLGRVIRRRSFIPIWWGAVDVHMYLFQPGSRTRLLCMAFPKTSASTSACSAKRYKPCMRGIIRWIKMW